MSIFLERPTPFMHEFLDRVTGINYDKSKIDLMVHNAAPFHEKQMSEFVEFWGGENNEVESYNSIEYISSNDKVRFECDVCRIYQG